MKRLFSLLVLLALVLPVLSAGITDKWVYPTSAMAPAQMPKLGAPLVLDGKLTEWKNALGFSIRSKSDHVLVNRIKTWLGPDDMSMDISCAWTPEGIALAATVHDQELINTRSDDRLWEQDCIELFVDGRPPNTLMTAPYSRGCYQLFIRPPLDGQPARFVTNPRNGNVEGLQIAGALVPGGYVVEMLIPWSAFPGFTAKEGSLFGLQFAVDDYDKRDGDLVQPRHMSYRAATNLFMQPQKFIKWQLVDTLRTGADVTIGPPLLILDVPQMVNDKSLSVTVEVSKQMLALVKAAHYTVTNPSGKTIYDRTMRVSGGRDNAPFVARFDWKLPLNEDGYYLVNTMLLDDAGKPLGFTSRPFFAAPNVWSEQLARIARLDIAKLSQQDPYRAAAYLAAGAALERVKAGLKGNPDELTRGLREFDARLQVLEGNTLPSGDKPYDLLNLAANPQAQVVVQFPEETFGAVTPYWGALPLGTAYVQQYASKEMADKAFYMDGTFPPWTEKTTINGLPAAVRTHGFSSNPLAIQAFDPARQVLNITASRGVSVCTVDNLQFTEAKAVVILDGCPVTTAEAVKAWATAKNIPLLGLDEAMAKGDLLVAGDFRAGKLAKFVSDKRGMYEFNRPTGFAGCWILAGNRLITIDSPSRPYAEKLAALILAGKPITEADVDALRQALLAAVAPKVRPASLPEGQALYCGDVHMHSFFSDGNISPIGLMLQAMYNNLDFAVMTDHNTLDGALLARELLTRYRFSFPQIIGEEVTTSWAHMNAYPLTKVISPELTPYEIAKAAHVQGAVIHWNHPGYSGSAWEQDLADGKIARGGMNAWEHTLAAYDRWKAVGTLPPLVGSTDTHSGTFDWPERTVILTITPTGDDLAETERRGKTVLLSAGEQYYVYGPDDVTSAVWAALAEGKVIKDAHTTRLQSWLKDADLLGLLKDKQTKP